MSGILTSNCASFGKMRIKCSLSESEHFSQMYANANSKMRFTRPNSDSNRCKLWKIVQNAQKSDSWPSKSQKSDRTKSTEWRHIQTLSIFGGKTKKAIRFQLPLTLIRSARELCRFSVFARIWHKMLINRTVSKSNSIESPTI